MLAAHVLFEGKPETGVGLCQIWGDPSPGLFFPKSLPYTLQAPFPIPFPVLCWGEWFFQCFTSHVDPPHTHTHTVLWLWPCWESEAPFPGPLTRRVGALFQFGVPTCLVQWSNGDRPEINARKPNMKGELRKLLCIGHFSRFDSPFKRCLSLVNFQIPWVADFCTFSWVLNVSSGGVAVVWVYSVKLFPS